MDYEAKRKHLVTILKEIGRIKSESVEKAFLETPRELFVSDETKKYAYIDTPLEIGEHQNCYAHFTLANI